MNMTSSAHFLATSTFVCSIDGCGRRFDDKSKLEDHIHRRHLKYLAEDLKQQNLGGNKQLGAKTISATMAIPKRPTNQLLPKLPQIPRDEAAFFAKSQLVAQPKRIVAIRPLSMDKKNKEDSITMSPGGKKPLQLPPVPLRINSAGNRSMEGFETKSMDISTTFDNESTIKLNHDQEKIISAATKTTVKRESSRERKLTLGKKPEKELESQPNSLDKKDDVEIEDDEDESISDDDELEIEFAAPSQSIDYQKLLESKKKLTKAFILEAAGHFDSLSEVTHLVLLEKGLLVFEKSEDFNPCDMLILEFLSLSHNQLFNVIGISQLTSLIELNINFNHVEDITPIRKLENLEKFFASNNRIKDMSPLQGLTKLNTLALAKNHIKSMDSVLRTLGQLTNLKDLELHNNPVSKKYGYKYDILWLLQLEYLDGDKVTDIDYELSKTFQEEIAEAKLKIGLEPAMAGGLKRPSTAPGRSTKAHDFVSKFKNQMKTPGESRATGSVKKDLKDIPEAVEKEKVAKYEEEIELLKEERDDLKAKVAQLELERKNVDGQLLLFRCENTELKMQLNELRQVQQENRELRKKMDILNEAKDRDLKNEVVLLNMKLEEVLKENVKLKENQKKVTKHDKPVSKPESKVTKESILRGRSRAQQSQMSREPSRNHSKVSAKQNGRNSNFGPSDEEEDNDDLEDDDFQELEDLLIRNSLVLEEIRNDVKAMNNA